jgi:hypothetical protein
VVNNVELDHASPVSEARVNRPNCFL